MDEATSKPGMNGDIKRLVNLEETEVCRNELAYVTAVDKEEVLFFAQLCKFTNHDLVQHNTKIHVYCERVALENKAAKINAVTSVKAGEVLCARYYTDDKWYRTMVKSADDTQGQCKAYFIDYGNIENVYYTDLLRVSPANMPEIERAPFGFYCKLKDLENYDSSLLLRALEGEYILMRVLDRLDVNKWCVSLPNVAYNQTFVNTYQTG